MRRISSGRWEKSVGGVVIVRGAKSFGDGLGVNHGMGMSSLIIISLKVSLLYVRAFSRRLGRRLYLSSGFEASRAAICCSSFARSIASIVGCRIGGSFVEFGNTSYSLGADCRQCVYLSPSQIMMLLVYSSQLKIRSVSKLSQANAKFDSALNRSARAKLVGLSR